ncbi:hypothetical protein DLAC_10019 [Tieghemostelium lacteum]|uniref:Glycosylphosphatidylinositol anchor attachment 1 protein n=1 Tax=Tieghemostelium lacteum TaxID=361077 RepID=A0A151Z5X2_TIELA|nr:hypothetical protein DLAC_10019 [Tieghemostelium lacteum]|eukprot:KYQ89356.1 hypothetical protein DLAC_10019 [Tieghemostelium lacteum]
MIDVQTKKDKSKLRLVFTIGFLLYAAGIVSIYFYPINAHNTYMSENALMPGLSLVDFDHKESHRIIKYSKSFQSETIRNEKDQKKSMEWIHGQLLEMGLDSYLHKYNATDGTVKYNVYSVLRAPKSDGTESIVISTQFKLSKASELGTDEISSIGFIMSICEYIYTKGRSWLAKDLILVISSHNSDSELDNGQGIRSWLHDYHDSNIGSSVRDNFFPRAGLIQSAINFEIDHKFQDKIYILSEGSNGQLPNLDLINTIGRLARKEGIQDLISLSDSVSTSESLMTIFQRYTSLALPENFKTLFRFMMNQAIGKPTGNHGIYNRYHIDAVTIGIPPGIPNSYYSNNNIKFLTKISKITIGTIRSLNNLLERLHQSFYYYLLPSPFHYISIGEYMISLGLILAPLIIRIVYLLITLSTTFKSDIFLLRKNKSTNSPVLNSSSPSPSSSSPSTPPTTPSRRQSKLSQLLSKIFKMETSDSPRDIVYSIIVVCLFQIIGILLYLLPQTFNINFNRFKSESSLSTTSLTLPPLLVNLLDEIKFITVSLFLYLIVFKVILKKIDNLFSTPPTSTSTTTTAKKLGGNSFIVFSNLPILVFITSMSLLNFSFCTFASILSIPLCILSFNSNSNSIVTYKGSKIQRLFVLVKNIVFLMLSPVILLPILSRFYLDVNIFTLLNELVAQYQLYSNLFFPFLTLIYLPLNLSILKYTNN